MRSIPISRPSGSVNAHAHCRVRPTPNLFDLKRFEHGEAPDLDYLNCVPEEKLIMAMRNPPLPGGIRSGNASVRWFWT